MSGLQSQLLFWLRLLGSVFTERRQVVALVVTAQVVQCVPPMWEVEIEFYIPGYSLAQTWVLWLSGDWTSRWRISQSLNVSAFFGGKKKWSIQSIIFSDIWIFFIELMVLTCLLLFSPYLGYYNLLKKILMSLMSLLTPLTPNDSVMDSFFFL